MNEMEQELLAKAKPATLKNIAHGQLSEIVESLMEAVAVAIHNETDPETEHEVKFGLKFFRDKDTKVMKVRPTGKISMKNTKSLRGHDAVILVTPQGLFQPTAGKQMRLDAAEGEEE